MTDDPIKAIGGHMPGTLETVEAKAKDLAQAKKNGDAAKELEKLFMSLVVKEMRRSLPEGMFGKATGANVYSGLFDQMMADALVQGEGTGLRKAIAESWQLQATTDEDKSSEKTLSENTTP